MRIKNNKKVLWITRTGVMLALLIVLQWSVGVSTAALIPPFNTLIVGSIVNTMLIISVMFCKLATGLTIAALSPVAAFFFGIMKVPNPIMIPFVCLGNIVLILLWHFIGNRKTKNRFIAQIIALVVAATGKFLVLHFGITEFVAPVILELPPASPVYTMFSLPQLATASIGGAVALVVLPVLNAALKKPESQ